ncbi:RING-H2 finger protein ATL74-like [Magnolia sinica]|uniref:RING-H2 finger protein ATL74-like n=1 Tax=Magnolia sinica TaxID=86752 RepID=UPI002657DA14|nr:RING-H2 finger protein ATL74-like [Magnolia sinica]
MPPFHHVIVSPPSIEVGHTLSSLIAPLRYHVVLFISILPLISPPPFPSLPHLSMEQPSLPHNHKLLVSTLAPTQSPTSSIISAIDPEDTPLDFNVVVILAAMLCALVCALGLHSMLQCVVRCTQRVVTEPVEWVAARRLNAGLKKEDVIALPTSTYATSGSPGSTSRCAICLADFSDGDKIRLIPKCNHRFHVACIDTWLMSHSSCPTCRQRLSAHHSTASLEIVTSV